MKNHLARLAGGAFVLAVGILGTAAPSNAATVTPMKYCGYENGARCSDSWSPSDSACKNIAKYGTQNQIMRCGIYMNGLNGRG